MPAACRITMPSINPSFSPGAYTAACQWAAAFLPRPHQVELSWRWIAYSTTRAHRQATRNCRFWNKAPWSRNGCGAGCQPADRLSIGPAGRSPARRFHLLHNTVLLRSSFPVIAGRSAFLENSSPNVPLFTRVHLPYPPPAALPCHRSTHLSHLALIRQLASGPRLPSPGHIRSSFPGDGSLTRQRGRTGRLPGTADSGIRPHGRVTDVGQVVNLRTDCQSVQPGAARPGVFTSYTTGVNPVGETR